MSTLVIKLFAKGRMGDCAADGISGAEPIGGVGMRYGAGVHRCPRGRGYTLARRELLFQNIMKWI